MNLLQASVGIAIASFLVSFAGVSHAQTTTLTEKDRIIELAPAFRGRSQTHQFWTTSSQSQWVWHAGAAAADGAREWIQIYELQRGWHWPQQSPITESSIGGAASFFKDRKIEELRGDLGDGGSARDRLALFRSADQECAIRIVYDDLAVFSSTMSSTLPNRVAHVTCCATPGERFGKAEARRKTAEWSAKGWGHATPFSAQ